MTAEPDPSLYYCIGRLKGIPPIARNRFDDLLYKPLGEIALSIILATGPDGLIFQRGGESRIPNRQRLEPFEPNRKDRTNQRQAIPVSEEITREGWAETMKRAKQAAIEWYLRYERRVYER
jgi:hypothetical protein